MSIVRLLDHAQELSMLVALPGAAANRWTVYYLADVS